MKLFNSILVLAAAFLAVFAEAAFQLPRHLLGAQVDLLPALMIYAALNTDVATVSLLAVLGGLWFDALSANPLGVSILPLFAVGYPDLSAARFDFARAAVRPGHSRRGGQRGGAGAVCVAVVDRRAGAAAGLGFALAMAGDDGGRRGGHTGHFRAVRPVPARASATSRKWKPVSVPTAKYCGIKKYESTPSSPQSTVETPRRRRRHDCGPWTVDCGLFAMLILDELKKNDPQLRLFAVALAGGLVHFARRIVVGAGRFRARLPEPPGNPVLPHRAPPGHAREKSWIATAACSPKTTRATI